MAYKEGEPLLAFNTPLPRHGTPHFSSMTTDSSAGENSTWSSIVIIICAMAGVGVVRFDEIHGNDRPHYTYSWVYPMDWHRAAGLVSFLISAIFLADLSRPGLVVLMVCVLCSMYTGTLIGYAIRDCQDEKRVVKEYASRRFVSR